MIEQYGQPTISVKDRLPEKGQKCLWWHSGWKDWYTGIWKPRDVKLAPGFFIGYIQGNTHDGTATYRLPMPPNPEGEQ